MAENIKNPKKEGGEAAGVRVFLQSLRPIGVALWYRDMGGYLTHGTGPGWFPIPGGEVINRKTAKMEAEKKQWEYTSSKADGEEPGFELMETYIRQSQNTFAQYIATQTITLVGR